MHAQKSKHNMIGAVDLVQSYYRFHGQKHWLEISDTRLGNSPDMQLIQKRLSPANLKSDVKSVLRIHSAQAYIPMVGTRPLECC